MQKQKDLDEMNAILRERKRAQRENDARTDRTIEGDSYLLQKQEKLGL